MRTALLALVLVCVAVVSLRADEPLSIEAIAAIAKARAKNKPSTPPTPKPIVWESYPAAYAKCRDNGIPLVVLASAPGCLPCQTLKKELEAAAIQGVAYCYLDITASPENAALLGIGSTVPELIVNPNHVTAGKRYHGTQLHPGIATAAVKSLVKPNQ